MSEQLSNLGYLASRPETSAGTIAGVPNIYLPIYSESLGTEANYAEDMPIMAQKFFRYQVLRGNRSHKGGFVCMAEPNTAGYIMDMLYTKGTSSGTSPTTHPFTLSAAAQPRSYTLEISLGTTMAVRFLGFGASNAALEWESGEGRFNVGGAALKSFMCVRSCLSLGLARTSSR